MDNKTQAIHMAYQLKALMRVLSLAVQGQDSAGLSFEQCGGDTVLELASDMAHELAELIDFIDPSSLDFDPPPRTKH